MILNISKTDLLIIFSLTISFSIVSLLFFECINNKYYSIIITLFLIGITIFFLSLIYRKHLKGFL